MLHKPDNGLFYGERGEWECEKPFQGDCEKKSVNKILL